MAVLCGFDAAWEHGCCGVVARRIRANHHEHRSVRHECLLGNCDHYGIWNYRAVHRNSRACARALHRHVHCDVDWKFGVLAASVRSTTHWVCCVRVARHFECGKHREWNGRRAGSELVSSDFERVGVATSSNTDARDHFRKQRVLLSNIRYWRLRHRDAVFSNDAAYDQHQPGADVNVRRPNCNHESRKFHFVQLAKCFFHCDEAWDVHGHALWHRVW